MTLLDAYKILGLMTDASDEQVKKAYRELVKRYHPDNNLAQSEEKKQENNFQLKRINDAFKIIMEVRMQKENRSAQEQAAREQAAQEQAAREQAAREQAAREQAAQERAAREQAAQEQAAQEKTTQGKENVRKDDAMIRKSKKMKYMFSTLIIMVVGIVIVLVKQETKRNFENIIKRAEIMVSNENYMEAIDLLNTVGEKSDFYIDAQTKISEIKGTYERSAILYANTMISDEEYMLAYEKIIDAENDLGERDDLEAEKVKIKRTIYENVTPDIIVTSDVLEYTEGDGLNVADFNINLSYLGIIEEDKKPVDINPNYVEQAGENKIMIEWSQGKEYEFLIEANPKIVSIQATYIGENRTKGDIISQNLIEVEGKCSDGSTRAINNYDIYPTVLQNVGENIISIKYDDLKCDVSISALPQYTYLKDIKAMKSGDFRTSGEDTFGNSYLNYLLLNYESYDFDGHGNQIYNIDGKYTHFCTTIAPGTFSDGGMHNGGGPITVEIVGDGTVLYSSPEISFTTSPFSVDVDVTGVKLLEFRANSSGAIFLDDPKLY